MQEFMAVCSQTEQCPMAHAESMLAAISKMTEPFFKKVKAFGEITLLNGTKISHTWFYAALPRQELRAIHTFQTTVVSRGSHP